MDPGAGTLGPIAMRRNQCWWKALKQNKKKPGSASASGTGPTNLLLNGAETPPLRRRLGRDDQAAFRFTRFSAIRLISLSVS